MSLHRSKFAAAFGVALAASILVAEPADARRGGSFGSRGARTYTPPPRTQTAPTQTAPIERSMTPRQPTAQQPGARPATAGAPAAQPRRGGFLGGLGGGLLGGLLLGGLFGALLGHGFGAGMAGFAALLFQLALIGLGVFLLMKLFRRRQQPAAAGAAAAGWPGATSKFEAPEARSGARPMGGTAYTPSSPASAAPPAGPAIDLAVTAEDRSDFERLLTEVQTAFGREDYGTLREVTTPEVMSYLSEELSQNATQGRRNEVTDVKLLEADIAEAWREGDREYVTAALRYESRDVMRDRTSGQVVSGDAEKPTQTTELWTFVRQAYGPWKLSAIQEA
ncbi:Tim44 domain-containing protein [Phenylobacterium sp.]|jgi:predicted lipid-binding transport protein (Tim44 family)|uniref:Tim44 domain-containing protein n=1 Tax=Phenylobacterium sp. TaxID=1871053 RepID=UPI002F95A21D